MAADRATWSLKALGRVLTMLALCQVAAARDGVSQPSDAPSATAPDLPAAGRSTGLPVPRFVSLGADQVNLRYGPGREYPVSWVLARRGLPVEIIAEFDAWRKVRLHDATRAGSMRSLLSSPAHHRDQGRARRAAPHAAADAPGGAAPEPGVIGELLECEGGLVPRGNRRSSRLAATQAFWGRCPARFCISLADTPSGFGSTQANDHLDPVDLGAERRRRQATDLDVGVGDVRQRAALSSKK